MLCDERAKSARTNPTGAVANIENARTNPATARPNEPGKRSPERTQEADRLRFPKAYRLPAPTNDDEGGPNEPEPPPDGEGLLAGYRYFLGHGRDEAARYWLLCSLCQAWSSWVQAIA